MADIQYWDDTLTEEIENVQSMLDHISKMNGHNPMERQSAIDRAKARLRSATGTKRSFKMECRLVQDVNGRRKYEKRLASLDQTLKMLSADLKALESEQARGELFVSADYDDDNPFKRQEMDGAQAGDSMLKEASGIQDKTQESLMNTRNRITESKEVGISTLEELERQRDVINSIEKETDRIDDNLARAEVLLKQFGKRMASDHFIQCFALINCLLLLGVVLYAVIKGGGLGLGNSGTPASPVDGDSGTARLLFLRRGA
ncbi:predicted protein [Phaeodactylum tricornutum CCAP 1055/1]|jgi:SNARE protein|uniref:t-SNARE coiled-coil homology domain-containing protein n=2 Tax=Phaeodactylum tricornutum TaxID=2850 RepID=B7G5Z1_PHATC|nr:predicted protein [Phaeodactylum tricornutum CCAP 1055/1]EEC45772.1 predicted protein [Phaeodactylum tricornutum CCAP 1055/1]|eukprot:XP_002182485.1 predicted protein [Phaeodactylum tricornutum CCAP 1055/1]